MYAMIKELKYGRYLGSQDKLYSFPGMTVSILQHKTESKIPRHSHNSAHFIFLMNGYYTTESHNINGQCGPGTIIFNPAGITHKDQFISPHGECLIVSLKEKYLEEIYIQNNLPEKSFGYTKAKPCLLTTKLLKELNTGDDLTQLIMEEYVLSILSGWSGIPKHKETQMPKWLKRLLDYLQNSDPLPKFVAELSQIASVHPHNWTELSQKYFNCTPGEFLRYKRIGKAAWHLRNTDKPSLK